MRTIELTHHQLNDFVWFTDPLIHSPEQEEQICSRFERCELSPPCLVEHNGHFLVFNGNHRILVARNYQWKIPCTILETLDDIVLAQSTEIDNRDLSMVVPLTFEGVVDELLKGAEQHRYQDPEKYSFRDF
jgi:ParB-like chromosome segregation protein Spo0J